MFSLWVTLEVKPECREKFLEAIEVNAQASVCEEEGCFRFDVIELGETGSNRFAFYELYRDEAAFEVEHMQASHFLIYKEIAARVVVPGSQVNVTGTLLHGITAEN
jgi:quinol monooxygenase YgiN